jgi:hypothetical protein
MRVSASLATSAIVLGDAADKNVSPIKIIFSLFMMDSFARTSGHRSLKITKGLIFYSSGSVAFVLGQEMVPFRWNTGRNNSGCCEVGALEADCSQAGRQSV